MPISHISTVEDELNLELEAMQTIARTLIRLRDSHTRDRVLRWTNERFNVAPTAVAAPPASVATRDARPAFSPDPSLTVDARDFFPDAVVDVPVPSAAASVAEPLDSLVRGFASDFRALAIQWQRA
jgi:hypothetical protein